MNKYVYLGLLIFALLIILKAQPAHKVYAQQQVTIPSITPYWIKRQAYYNAGALVLSKLKAAQAAQDSKGWLTIIPSILGGSVIAAGSVLAWLNSQKRQKIFKKYMEDLTLAEQTYSNSVLGNPKSKAKSLAKLKEDFSTLQEKADLSAGNKKIDEEQRTTIFNTIQRKLEEIVKTS